ncbi:protein kinase domain-containing protein [Streptomyces lichenis]|uniref:non-specific serine/threonine protein kinase n=1 Tax=Streptomyces lichenis TaxID=2306967 RepID=A0ABT0I4K8_9ACTN|nr:protein kinase [Streptomyces lichenis]MCK8676212.1 protein kinase [Streptomyces lichenis]
MSQDGAHGRDGAQGRYAGGSVAGGRYQLRDLLGEGGMASVYLAYDTALDRQVAIKTLHTELGREASFRERFRREAQAVAKLQHTNIVSVFDTGEDTVRFGGSTPDGSVMPYIVMEYVEGRPLGSVLAEDVRQYGAMPADKALKVTADVLAALETSHEMGLVHRDIKPGNVMMTRRGVIKVMDFGIARAMQSGVTSMTQTGMVVGTPQYLSPEQALGRGVDARSDLYSVGIMLFQLLTGRLPFEADSPLAIAYAHVQEEPAAPSSINRAVTPAVDALVARALKKNPNERFPNAAAMRDECLRLLSALSAGHTAAPSIVPNAPQAASGSGVGSAVFPPVDQGTPAPAPHSVQTPYQPGPAPHSYGVPTPAPSYGYPQQQPPAYHTPGPAPAPYHLAPQPTPLPTPPKRRNTPLLIGAAAVVLIAVIGTVAALSMRGNDDPGTTGAGGTTPSAGTPSKSAEHRPPERHRTMKTTVCSDATEDYDDPEKVQAPDFRYKDVLSVKACLQAAGWKIDEKETDDPRYAEDQVISQFPLPGTAVDPSDQTFQITIATGDDPE